MHSCDITVVILAYNHEKYIRQAVESVLSQKTNLLIEIIIGEDNSSDKTVEFLKQIENNPQITIYFNHDNSNKLFIDGRMTGRRNMIDSLQRARGKYIAYLDGDDYWIDEDKLHQQYIMMENNPDCTLCYHDCYMLKDGISKNYPNFYTERMTDEDIISQKVVPASSTIFFKNVGFENLPEAFFKAAFGDRVLYAYLLRFGNSCYIRKKMSVYRVHSDSIWATKFTSTLYAIDAQRYLIEQLPDILEKRLDEFKSAIKKGYYLNNLRRLKAISRTQGYIKFIRSYLWAVHSVVKENPGNVCQFVIFFIKESLVSFKRLITHN